MFCHKCIYEWYFTCNSLRDPEMIHSDLNNPCPLCRVLSTDETWDKVINGYCLDFM